MQRIVDDLKAAPSHNLLPHRILLETYTLPPTRQDQKRVMDPNLISGFYLVAYALIDRSSTYAEEMTLSKGDKLRIYARCNHWSFAVKERQHDYGWVPSWESQISSQLFERLSFIFRS